MGRSGNEISCLMAEQTTLTPSIDGDLSFTFIQDVMIHFALRNPVVQYANATIPICR